jgi:hypothetical protein
MARESTDHGSSSAYQTQEENTLPTEYAASLRGMMWMVVPTRSESSNLISS